MKLAMVASGTRGDVQPYIALGQGLKSAGHSVRVLTSEDFEGLVSDAGLEFCSTGMSIERLLQSEEWNSAAESGNFLKILAKMQTEMKRRARDQAAMLPPMLEGADLIIAGMGGWGGPFSIAEMMKIPLLQAYLLPVTPTREFSSPLTSNLPLGGPLNRLAFHAMRQMIWQSVRVGDSAVRQALSMRPGAFWGPFRSLDRQRIPVLYGFSPQVLPRPADWEAHLHVTGYWFLDATTDWRPPTGLDDFLRKGSPPVYIGFGSMSSRDPEAAARLALEALALSGQRGILASGWGGLRASDLPETVYTISSAPHSWLFPQMAAVVHHGGVGTTAAGLRAGVPSIIIPFMGDQSFWGKRIADLGVGTAPIQRRRLTAERLARAITEAVGNETVRQRAAELGKIIQAEDGVGQAVALIQSYSEQL